MIGSRKFVWYVYWQMSNSFTTYRFNPQFAIHGPSLISNILPFVIHAMLAPLVAMHDALQAVSVCSPTPPTKLFYRTHLYQSFFHLCKPSVYFLVSFGKHFDVLTSEAQ
jgi:hypothetical protein